MLRAVRRSVLHGGLERHARVVGDLPASRTLLSPHEPVHSRVMPTCVVTRRRYATSTAATA